VTAPGIYQVEAGETCRNCWHDLGRDPNAYLYGAEFTRESVRQQQQKNLDAVIRKLEAQLQSEIGNIIRCQCRGRSQGPLLSQQQQLSA